MRLQWKGRSYRPVANYVKVSKPSINELIKPLSMKSGLGSAILTGELISGIGDAYGPDVPVVTPSSTPSITPTPSSTPAAEAFMYVNVFESDNRTDVVWSGSGNFNTFDLTLTNTYINFGPGNDPNTAHFGLGPIQDVLGFTGATSIFPPNFGVVGTYASTVDEGNYIGAYTDNQLLVSSGYTSGSQISGKTTYTGSSITSLGLTPGTYNYSWTGNTGSKTNLILTIDSPLPSPTPSETPTNTPTVTPSSTPFPFVQPSLWFDASDSTTMNLILSGGTTYISQLTSKGTSNWTLTGQTSDRYPTYSASTSLPGSPNIIRFTPNATAALRKGLVAFDRPVLTHTGSTIFVVWAQPAGTPAFNNQLYSGNTNGTLVQSGSDIFDRYQFVGFAGGANIANTNVYPQSSSQVVSIPSPYTATTLNGKYLMKVVLPASAGYGSWELNQSGATSTSLFTGTTVSPRWNAFNLGCTSNNTGQLFTSNNNIELAEMMVFNYELSSSEQEAVELYLRDKWRYDEWASPVPTPTQTPSMTQSATPQVTSTPTNTPTPSITPSVSPTITMTPTNTTTITPTPSSTPPPFVPSGITNLQYWFMSPSGSSVSSWTNYGLLGGAVSQGTAAFQPAKITNDTFGTGFTGTSMSFANQDTMSAFFTNTSFTAKTFFAVFKVVGRSIQDTFLSLRSSNTDSNATRVFNYDMYASPTTHNTQSIPGVSTFTATTGSFIFASSGSSNSFRGELNGVLGSSGTTAFSQTSGQFFEFGYNPGSANSNDVRIFEFIAYNRELTSSEYSSALNYLKTKYNYYP